MESLKIDCRGLNEVQKNDVVNKLKSMGYVGDLPYRDFYFYCVYTSGTPSKHGYSLGFGNNMKTFSSNKGREITLQELELIK